MWIRSDAGGLPLPAKGVAETVDMGHIETRYFVMHRQIDRSGLIREGPALDLDSPHGRADGIAFD